MTDQLLGVRRVGGEDVTKIRERGAANQSAASNEGIEKRGAVSALETAREDPVLPARGVSP